MLFRTNCKVCRLVQNYLMVSIPIVFMMWLRPDFKFPEGVDVRAIIGNAIGVSLFLMVCWRIYADYLRK